jgi:putative FmdB family regulatory protein
VQKDVMQKISDAKLTACPGCGQETFEKQLSAAGFQFKGNGYYATDFKDKPASPREAAPCAECSAVGGNA